jgi:NO-binding membrane sensor protein with MHYT domain
MKRTAPLTITSSITIFLLTVHLAQDSVHFKDGTTHAGTGYLIVMAVLAVVLYGTLALADRRSGRILMLIGSLGGLAMPVIHVRGLAGLRGDFGFVWTLLLLGVVSLTSLILSIDALWRREPSPR